MTDTEKQQIEFYTNGSAKSVLERFTFSNTEKKLIEDAIRTAKMIKPRMKLIDEADKLLKEVAKTREALPSQNIREVPFEAIVQFNNMKFNASQPKEEKKGIPFFYIPKTKLGKIIFFLMMAALSALQYFTIGNVQDKSNDSSQLLYEEQIKLMQGF